MEKRKINEKAELKMRIARLAAKIFKLTHEIKYFSILIKRGDDNGTLKHWRKMAKRSLIATRKKIYVTESRIQQL